MMDEDNEEEKHEKTIAGWGQLGMVAEVKYQLRKPECELQFCFLKALIIRNGT